MTSPESHVLSVFMQVHLTLSGRLTCIHILLTVLIKAGCRISMISVANSLDKLLFNISVPSDTHVCYFIHMITSGILYPHVQGWRTYGIRSFRHGQSTTHTSLGTQLILPDPGQRVPECILAPVLNRLITYQRCRPATLLNRSKQICLLWKGWKSGWTRWSLKYEINKAIQPFYGLNYRT